MCSFRIPPRSLALRSRSLRAAQGQLQGTRRDSCRLSFSRLPDQRGKTSACRAVEGCCAHSSIGGTPARAPVCGGHQSESASEQAGLGLCDTGYWPQGRGRLARGRLAGPGTAFSAVLFAPAASAHRYGTRTHFSPSIVSFSFILIRNTLPWRDRNRCSVRVVQSCSQSAARRGDGAWTPLSVRFVVEQTPHRRTTRAGERAISHHH